MVLYVNFFFVALGLASAMADYNYQSPYGPDDESYRGSAKHGGSQGVQCYQCTSYAGKWCGEQVNKTAPQMPIGTCPNGCYVKQGYEDPNALYRGCVDDYLGVDYLATFLKQEGCHDIKWHNKKTSQTWCVCKSNDLCNGLSIQQLQEVARSNTISDDDSYNYVDQGPAKQYYETQDDTSKDTGKVGYFPETQYQDPEPKKAELKNKAPHSYYYEPKEVFTDVEQVHYGTGSNDIFVNQPNEDNVYDSLFEFPNFNEYYGSADGINKIPYYPYEGKDFAYRDKMDQYSNSYGNDYTRSDKTSESNLEARNAESHPQEDETKTIEVEADEEEDLAIDDKKLLCSKNGFIPNPEDCSKFLACIMEPNVGKPVMYAMRCPHGLYWDNKIRNCVSHSTTCRTTLQAKIPEVPSNSEEEAYDKSHSEERRSFLHYKMPNPFHFSPYH